ncbi:DoxX family protein [Dyadobacter chenwenxiniae]|uniref:DoxX family protein n=1 Tax=Dyadobacter chenwenxiniae TaxID=2906456 RepID=A0A9X1TGL9_9BACT|nr:DoxX family protein [Dyadobacter chenwenxiniae]MCF0063759.1 DoxX family protein [Dyadobacter chenwenxiniae]UON83435.1 DoxX family protein [Dyadobacter chenwenxiniae]
MEKKQIKFRRINTLLWSLQIILAATFLSGGFIKLFTPADQLSRMWPWTTGNPLLVTIAGLADTLAGIGILLPRILRIWPVLTLYTSYGIILLMVVAIIFHVSRGEVSQLGINFAVTLITVMVIFLWKYSRKDY